jgi:hypothetical protein
VPQGIQAGSDLRTRRTLVRGHVAEHPVATAAQVSPRSRHRVNVVPIAPGLNVRHAICRRHWWEDRAVVAVPVIDDLHVRREGGKWLSGGLGRSSSGMLQRQHHHQPHHLHSNRGLPSVAGGGAVPTGVSAFNPATGINLLRSVFWIGSGQPSTLSLITPNELIDVFYRCLTNCIKHSFREQKKKKKMFININRRKPQLPRK